MRSDDAFDLIGLLFGVSTRGAGLPRLRAPLEMRIRLLMGLIVAVALTVGAALGFLVEQATQPSDLAQPSDLTQPLYEPD
jgi:hypothetical protein